MTRLPYLVTCAIAASLCAGATAPPKMPGEPVTGKFQVGGTQGMIVQVTVGGQPTRGRRGGDDSARRNDYHPPDGEYVAENPATPPDAG